MILPPTDPGRETEIARLADAFDAVPAILAACAGFSYDRATPIDGSAWSFEGGEFALTWRDDQSVYFGGVESSEEAWFSGAAQFVLRPYGEGDRLSMRRAALILALRDLRDRGSSLAGLNAWLSIGNMRHVSPSGEEDGSVFVEVPFQLRIHLQVLEPPDDVG